MPKFLISYVVYSEIEAPNDTEAVEKIRSEIDAEMEILTVKEVK